MHKIAAAAFLFILLVSSCNRQLTVQGKAWVADGRIKVAVETAPEAEIKVKAHSADFQTVTGRTDHLGQTTLTAALPPKELFGLRVQARTHSTFSKGFGSTYVPLLTTRLKACPTPETTTGQITLSLLNSQLSSCPIDDKGGTHLIFSAPAGARLKIQDQTVLCDKDLTCRIPLQGFIATFFGADATKSLLKLQLKDKKRLTYPKAPRYEREILNVPLTLQKDGLTSTANLEASLKTNPAHVLFAMLLAGNPIPATKEGRGLLFKDQVFSFHIYYHGPMQHFADVSHLALSEKAEPRQVGRCGPYVDQGGQHQMFFNKIAQDVQLTIYDRQGHIVHKKLFEAPAPDCPSMKLGSVSGDTGIVAKPDENTIRAYLLELAFQELKPQSDMAASADH